MKCHTVLYYVIGFKLWKRDQLRERNIINRAGSSGWWHWYQWYWTKQSKASG